MYFTDVNYLNDKKIYIALIKFNFEKKAFIIKTGLSLIIPVLPILKCWIPNKVLTRFSS